MFSRPIQWLRPLAATCLFGTALFALPVGERMALGAGHAGTGVANPDLDHVVPMFPAASDGVRQGFVRIINHSPRAGEVHIEAYDDGGTHFGPVTLDIDADETVHFNSADLEVGNAAKGLREGTGPGYGDWWLALSSDLDAEVLSYIRTPGDGFLTSMHDVVPVDEDGDYRVAIFNPGSNTDQVSRLRLVNAGEQAADVTITGVDDRGASPGGAVRVSVPAGAARTLAADELESGAGLQGALGDGTGKWALRVESDPPVLVMSLLQSPTGHLTNLSTAPDNVDAGVHAVPLFPAASDPLGRQGFVRVINHSALAGDVTVAAFDDTNRYFGSLTLSLDANETVHFNSDDLEAGNADKGLSGSTGAGEGDWRLELSSALNIEVLAYIRTTSDGFLTAMHDTVSREGNRHRVAIFNPGSNVGQVSRLRLVNAGNNPADVTIAGIDDDGALSSGGSVAVSVPTGTSRTLTAQELEAGGDGFEGGLGDGAGKWQLVVESEQPIMVMSLLSSPTGHLTNLSTAKFAPATVADLDRSTLAALYHATNGPNWYNSENWLTDAPLGDWFGVQTDGSDRVVLLELPLNNLSGPIPPEIDNLASLHTLVLGRNNLTGSIPPELGNLPNLTRLELYVTALSGEIPPELDNLAGLEVLDLGENAFTGPIPPEFGNLNRLTALNLYRNDLSGPIPPELGDLAQLRNLLIDNNNLSGPIPPELGNLGTLTHLWLYNNDLSGPIPPELGNLGLWELWLSGNNLSGSIPPELGDLIGLDKLILDNNDLTGLVPPELGGMQNLTQLTLAKNPGMFGALPAELTNLRNLQVLVAWGTDLCVPQDSGFKIWLQRVYAQRVAPCGSTGPSMAYLTQAVQSREYPVPLVAGEEALLRVFVTAARTTTASVPPVRARFYLNGTERHVTDIAGKTAAIPTEVLEHDLSVSANAEIPGEVVQPGLEMVIEIDPDGTLEPELGVTKRIPEMGRIAVEVHEMPLFDLTVIPFLWSADPNSEVVEAAGGMAADPKGHELLWETRTLLPVGDLKVTAHDPVLSSSNNAFTLRDETEAIRVLEGGGGHYMGMMSGDISAAAGVAFFRARSSFSVPRADYIAHEFGHNLGLLHAPCGTKGFVDTSFPYPDGSMGVWGYDFRDGGRLVGPREYSDLMSYCSPQWISDYHFANSLRYRLIDEGVSPSAARAAREAESLLLWGGTDTEGEPFLNPAFVVDAPPVLPDSTGTHRITGRTADGDELFSLSFAMPEVADGDGSSSFAFVLPVQLGWAGNLATITLSGSGGSATLSDDTDTPISILLDRSTGQVRGILRDPSQADAAVARVPQAGLYGLDEIFSRGMPDAEAWGR